MNTTIKTLSLATLTLFSISATAQNTTQDLLDTLQVTSDTPVMELNVGQLIKIVRFAPLIQPICADFSGYTLGQQFAAAQAFTVQGIEFKSYYGGGARISNWPGYGNLNFLEMVEDGAILITLPVEASEVTLQVMQAGNNPNVIDYFSYGSSLGTTTTSQYNMVEQVKLTGTAITSISINNPELFISEVCFQ